MSEERKMQIIGKINIKPIRFDVYLNDPYADGGNWGEPALENVGHIEALLYLSECSYFNFKICEHKTNNIFIKGSCDKAMIGNDECSLGWSSEDKCDDIKKMIRCKL